jgi:hypothetical protein
MIHIAKRASEKVIGEGQIRGVYPVTGYKYGIEQNGLVLVENK